MIYQIKKNNEIIIQNFKTNCYKCFNNTSVKGTLKLFCNHDKLQHRKGKLINNEYEIFLCLTNNVDSTRIFKENLNILLKISEEIEKIKKENLKNVERLLHNLKTYNAHCIISSDILLDPNTIQRNAQFQKESIKNSFNGNPNEFAQTILKIIKNIKLTQAEISIYEKLYKADIKKLHFANHQIHRLITSTLNIYWQNFIENGIYTELQPCTKEIYVDYETFTVCLVHLIDNCIKYVLPNSSFIISFKEGINDLTISFNMISLKINEDEVDDIKNEGVSGFYPEELNLQGKGIGLSVIDNFLNLNNGSLDIQINVDKSKRKLVDDIPYENNIFNIKIPVQK